MEKLKLDVKDRKVLGELEVNSRRSDAQIGKKVGLSQQVVSYRISRLVKSGAIRQFQTIIDTTKLGYSLYKAYFKLQKMTKEAETEMKQFLINHKSVLWTAAFDGAWDLGITLLAKSAREFDDLLKEFSRKFSQNILYKTVLLVLEAPHFAREYNKEARVVPFGGEEGIVKIDDVDKRILSIISSNSRMPYIKIAKNAKVGIDVARYRMKKLMESGVIKGSRAWLNADVIGEIYYKIFLSFQNITPEREKTLLGFCRRSGNVAFALPTIGAWDLELELHVKDTKEFHESVVELRNAFQDVIRNYDSLMIIEEYKYNYWPFQSK